MTQPRNLSKELCWFEAGIGDDQVALRSHLDYRFGTMVFEVKKKATSEDWVAFALLASQSVTDNSIRGPYPKIHDTSKRCKAR